MKLKITTIGNSAGVILPQELLARPQQRHVDSDPPPDLAALAASLAHGLARNRPFVDGNKRTAHVCYRSFLLLNGFELTASDEEKYVSMLALAAGELGEEDFAAWLRPRLTPRDPRGVNDRSDRYQVKMRVLASRKRA
jgi:death on curing protein